MRHTAADEAALLSYQQTPKLDLRVKNDRFAPSKAEARYSLLGYRPVYLNEQGVKDRVLGNVLAIRANKIATVVAHGVPEEAQGGIEWMKSPHFTADDGSVTFLFHGCGDIKATGILGKFTVTSYGPCTPGFERTQERFLKVPPQGGLIWRVEPRRIDALPILPAAIRFELFDNLRAAETAS